MPMTDEHKAALAQGRREARAVKSFLKAIESRRPGRPVTKESLEKRVSSLDDRIREEEDPVKRLDLVQERLDANESLKQVEARQDFDDLEQAFVDVAKEYSERKGISYTAWREIGVPAATLKKAGVPRTRRG
jgi:hypothetical protein